MQSKGCRDGMYRTALTLLALFFVLAPLLSFAAIVPCGDDPIANPCKFDDIIQLGQNIIDFLLTVVAVPIATLLFAYAGFLYLTAAGDMGKIKKVHSIFWNAFWGLALALAAWLIVHTLANVLLSPDYLPGS